MEGAMHRIQANPDIEQPWLKQQKAKAKSRAKKRRMLAASKEKARPKRRDDL
jgi:hypothetical protein